jgi:hypothetical protein
MTEGYRFNEFLARAEMIDALRSYAYSHTPVGGFLQACLENNLSDACGHADSDNLRNLPAIVAFIYNEVPSNAWGSPKAYLDWITPKEAA